MRRLDWSTALLELTIVVVGILIALQVDNWNENRKNRVEAQQWRAQILRDLYATRVELQARVEYYGAASKFGESALAGMQSEADNSPEAAWETILGAFQAGQIWPFQLTGPTYREAQNAGALGLVADTRELTALAELYDISAYQTELVAGGLPKYRDLIRERVSWPVQRYIWGAGCQRTIERPGTNGYSFELVYCPKPSLEVELRQNYTDLRADKVLQQALVGRLSQLKITDDNMRRAVGRVDRIIALMEDNS